MQCVQHVPSLQCFHGALSDVSCFDQIGSLQIMPGDGACFWHCCAHGGVEPGQWQINLAPQFKAEEMQSIASEPDKVAAILHASPSVAQALQTDWARWEDWADGRAMPLICVLKQVALVIINVMDGKVELFSPCANVFDSSTVWVFRLESDHFNYVHVSDPDRLRQVLSSIQLQLMLSAAEKLHLTLRGGASLDGDGLDASKHQRALQCWQAAEKPFDIPSNVAMCHSINVGGLRTHVHRLTASLGQGNHILAVQETLVSRQAQRTLTQSLQAGGMSVVWGTPAPIKVNRAGHWRVDRQHPGVAVIHSANLSVHSVSCITPAAQKWVQQGRMIMVRIEGGAKPLYLLNVYAPAGNAQRRLRALFLDQLLLELAHWHLCDMIVMGDVQGKWSDDFRYLQLALHGWRLPLPLTHDGNLAQYTYRCAGTYTFLDMVMCSPDIDPCIQHVTCHDIEGLLHSLISLQLRLDTIRPHQRVAYPPRLESSHGLLSLHDWDLTIANIREGVAQCLATFEGAEWIPVDSDIDSIWEVFTCSYRDHLYRSGVRALGQDASPLPDLQAVGKCGAHRATCRRQKARSSRDRRLYQALGWLTSLARNENPHSMQDKLRQNEDVICECFQLTRAAFRDALNSPSSFVSP